MGDPVCPPDRVQHMLRLFLERCDDFGGTPVFYEVGKDYLHHYADFGMTFVKLGEEARVDLRQFTLEGTEAVEIQKGRLDDWRRMVAHFGCCQPTDVPAHSRPARGRLRQLA